jgi:hypothetical protein
MRFSDMMGSGAERAPKPSTSESEAAITEALAPYLGAPPSEPEPVASPAAPVAVAAPVAAAVVVDRPLSDDLLPRRR